MIQSRISSKAQTTIPQAVRRALGVRSGDALAYVIEGDSAVIRRARAVSPDPFENPLATFTEWAGEIDTEDFANL